MAKIAIPSATPNAGKVLIKHACGHEIERRIRAPLGSMESRKIQGRYAHSLCPNCQETR